MLRKEVPFVWTAQCNSAFETLKEELCKMPMLQYPNPGKLYKLFTNASKYSNSGILHQEKEDEPDTLIPIAYFSGSFSKTQQLWNTTQKECYTVYKYVKRFSFYLTGAECTLYCDYKPLVPFLTTDMSSHVLDGCALELQQFNTQFNHIEGKRNVVGRCNLKA